MTVFDEVLTWTLKWEGGLVNDPDDRGGKTNRGITQANFNAWRASKGLGTRDVADISPFEVEQFYRERYWWDARIDKWAERRRKLALVHFDWGVNAGIARSACYLQAAVGAKVDGVIGPLTIAAAQACVEEEACRKYIHLREMHYRVRCGNRLPYSMDELIAYGIPTRYLPDVDKTQRKFWWGWDERVYALSIEVGV